MFCAPLFVGLGLTDLRERRSRSYSYAAERIVETGDWLNPIGCAVDRHRLPRQAAAEVLDSSRLPIRLGLLPDNDFGLRFWDAVMGGVAFLYVFAIGRRMAGWFCGAASLLLLYSFDSLIFTHGLRGNNMEAAVVLAYAGAVYHFLRWAEARRLPRCPGAHALAVALYFLLGFLSKFVAVGLPADHARRRGARIDDGARQSLAGVARPGAWRRSSSSLSPRRGSSTRCCSPIAESGR